ncbi:MAG: GAF domain-containing protein [Chloroflexi bacterium]|nr:MAG: GAF domain-containing protein [Chloroflexota bacterium]
MTSDARRQSARDLLEDAARQGNDLETVARGVLARLAELTGLSSTYLAETRLVVDEQYIVFSCNRSNEFHIPEDVTLPWSEGVCRFVVEGGPNYTTDAQKQFPSSSVARLLEIRTFISYPVFTAEGRFFGTLCGASKEQVEIQQEILELMRECARLIGQRLRRDAPASTPAP